MVNGTPDPDELFVSYARLDYDLVPPLEAQGNS
jgi:hypothetical protein